MENESPKANALFLRTVALVAGRASAKICKVKAAKPEQVPNSGLSYSL